MTNSHDSSKPFTNDPILLIGESGMLGRAWLQELKTKGYTFDAPLLEEFNIEDPASVEKQLSNNYKYVVNCAAYTAVDKCEDEWDAAERTNHTAVKLLADQCKKSGSTFIHYSTDYVFDGQATSPYKPDHTISPINAYGKSKALGEKALMDSRCEYLLIRISWLYGAWGMNFVLRMSELLCERDSINVVNDQRGRPTEIVSLTEATVRLLSKGANGVYHYSDQGECTWYELTAYINEVLGSPCTVNPITSDQYPTKAKRPAYSVLDSTKTDELIGLGKPWKENVKRVLQEAVLSQG